MTAIIEEQSWLDGMSPAATWDKQAAKRAIDELVHFTLQYRFSRAYHELMKFIGRFRFYSPYNAMLIHVQMRGAAFVAPPSRWQREYGRTAKPDARPLVILQPRGPVMFVFDVSDTEPTADARPLPPDIEDPFAVRRGYIGNELPQTIENAKRDGVRISMEKAGSQYGGRIRTAKGEKLYVLAKVRPQEEYVAVDLRYDLLLNRDASPETQYATLAHELGHLYCGHLGTPDPDWWPDRRGLRHDQREFEAESVAYLLCTRLGVDNPSEKYLAGYLGSHDEIPLISLECVLKAAGLIEQMGCGRLKPRKEKAR